MCMKCTAISLLTGLCVRWSLLHCNFNCLKREMPLHNWPLAATSMKPDKRAPTTSLQKKSYTFFAEEKCRKRPKFG